MIMMERHSGVSVSCDSDLSIVVKCPKVLHKWKFKISTKLSLNVVALLRRETGAIFTLGKNSKVENSYFTGQHYETNRPSSNKKVYEVTVSFRCDRPGIYKQWLVFDFHKRPVLLQKLEVRVGERLLEHLEDNQLTTNLNTEGQQAENIHLQNIWHEGVVEIVPFQERSVANQELLKTYSQVKRLDNVRMMEDVTINRQNYIDTMHSFLYQEEMATQNELSRLNLKGTMSLKTTLYKEWFGLLCAIPGELFGCISVPYSLTRDTTEGYMVKRHVFSVLVSLQKRDYSSQRVYEAVILKDATDEKQLNLLLSKRCCTELQLQNNKTVEMEVQFQVDHIWFCEMHKAVDKLPDLSRVLPDIKDQQIHKPIQSDSSEMNEKQQAAMNYILGSNQQNHAAPLLIYGPFGTGKTFTLAKITLALVQKPQNKVLICTHTNSSADIYVKDHFHKSVTTKNHPARPLRIKAKESPLKRTDSITLEYCHLSRDFSAFEFPDRETLDCRRVIITTTRIARLFIDLQLPSDYFSHIFIDEASQMLECEALMALGLAGEKTRVILAGDHMQMGPRLFSVAVDKSSDYTLLNRLFHYYQAGDSITAKKPRIIFNENYRSTKEIVDFVSTNFYVGKTDTIKAKGNVPPHPDQRALQFYHVRGECHLDKTSLSWFNPAEIQRVVEIVLNILEKWPNEWQHKDPASICVLSQGSQVIQIRNELKQCRLPAVTVQNAEDAQGKQFRVIIITTVHTKDSLIMTQQPCLEFFNDVRVLNTAMTRAQSQVIVVGDATALCCSYFGNCWRLWKTYIHYCVEARSVYPEDFTLDSLSQELLEISNTIKPEDDDNSDTESTTSELPDNTEDPILKELLDEDKDLQIKLTEEGLFPVLCSDNFQNNTINCVMQRRPSGHKPIVLSQFNQKICELVMERFDHGVARPLDDPSLKINIKGRKNLGQSFSGDIVRVEIIDFETIPPKGKVTEVIEPADLPGEFVCTIDSNDTQLMTPINMRIPKLFTPFWKDKPGYIAIRDPGTWAVKRFVKITMETRRNYLFVVKMLRWKKGFHYPLGIAVNTFPRVTSFKEGLKVLETEYTLKRIIPLPVEREVEKIIENTTLFTKDYQDFTKLMTFTIDCSKSKDLDDAISVRDLGQCYEIGIHIADVASFVNKDSELDKYAQQQGTTFYVSKAEPAHMFPSKLSTDFLSLRPGSNRRCISLITEVDKQTDCVQRTKFVKSVIQSKRKLSYEEAEKILKTSGDSYSFDTLEGCLAIACHFAEVHQKARKQEDWCYNSPDEDVVLGERRSRKLVEELMIMFNHTVADMLLSKSKTLKKTPLRCQTRPESDQLNNFREKNIAWLPMSIHLSARCNIHTESQQTGERFAVLTSILRQLKIAAKDNDINMIVDLVTTDEIYPQLLPLAIGLRRLLGKALILRSNSSYLSRIGHFDLQMDSYTWATSPIRRYVDVIVQRLLHSVLDNTEIQYSHNEIDRCCVEFTQKNRKQNECEKKSHALRLAFQLSNQNELHVAYIVQITPNGKDFMLSFPLNTDSINEMIRLKYRDLQLADQPAYDEVKNHMMLKWVRRMYFFSSSNMNELHPQDAASVTTYVPNESWKCLLAAIRTQNRDLMFQVIEQMNSFIHPKQPFRKKPQRLATVSEMKPSVLKEDHFTEMTLKLKKGENIEVQLGNDTKRGLLVPSVQLFIVNPEFEICLEHAKDPILCFSKYVLHPSKTSYNSYVDYQQIWKPLCEMESACSAVAENESIIIKNAPLIWKTVQDKALQGTFHLPLEKKSQWAIDGNLRNCFLCIRLRIQKKELGQSLNDSTPDPHNFTSAPGLIWVAHGVVTNVSDEEESTKLNYLKIIFRINHKPMTNVPGCIFSKDARFTIELIPKILPDVRKENAVENLTTANNLVKAIATGKKTTDLRTNIQNRVPVRFEIEDHQFLGSHLNTSQSHAIREALKNPFTLIQGPPGTGKTVVGVHIVYWFFKENLKKPADESENKRCILYCGPSNKSVDVVAGQLLKLQKTLKPLRVYSEQMEILEFPYPGSNLRLSRHSQRVEKPKSELRSITLHHRIRMKHNPFSSQILAFDLKIKQQESLSDEEIKSYKDCLRKARKNELRQHDVILCTCTAASHPLLAKTLSFEQIIIDECAMATEPEAFIPLVTHTPTQIVLIGDHKQLQPVVNCELLQKLGMTKSLFERYMKKALMLDTQYRMQEEICAFPSQEFYEGKLKTGTERKPSLFLSSSQSPTPIIFGHVEGEEISLVVSTEKGNENSKANIAEAEQAVRIANHLIKNGIKSQDIAILTPYNAQVSKVNEILLQYNIQNLTVSTIMKSQGSEWRCVILTTVRSCPKMDIETDPTKGWLLKYLGFVMVPHQVNVGITRAQEGLCILGNKDLLWCSSLWRRLLKHYQNKGCLINPADSIQISVARG